MTTYIDRTGLLLQRHQYLCDTARELMSRKNHDYTAASGDPFANFRGSDYLGIKPELGILLRMQDKMMRVRTFVDKGELRVKGENVKDALIDLINYTALLYGLIKEQEDKEVKFGQVVPVPEGRDLRTVVPYNSVAYAAVRREVPAAGPFCGSDYDNC